MRTQSTQPRQQGYNSIDYYPARQTIRKSAKHKLKTLQNYWGKKKKRHQDRTQREKKSLFDIVPSRWG